jgi:tripartite ATP-independent transporter DctM subunit
MGVLFTLVLAVIYRSINRKVLWESLLSTAKTTSMLLFLFITATILAHALANSGILRQISEWVGGLSLPSVYILLLIFGMYVILGMLMDGGAMMIITLPVVYPVITTLGINPIWFGIALVILIETGLLTPPVGLNLFVIQGVSRMSLGSVIAGSIPYVAIMFLMLVIIKIFPELVLWLPRTMIN